MAITLLTSVPGGGKTSYAVANVILQAHNEGKVIYTCGIPKLTVPTIELTYEQLRRWSDITINEKQLPELVNLEHNSIIVIDEVQKLWPAMGNKKTKDIEDLSVHRHYGLTFFIITQSPKLINRYVLELVDKHLHIRCTWAGRKLYEWAEYCNNTKAKSNRDLAIAKNYKLPKNAFSLYHSATAHIKPTRTLPTALFLLLIAISVVLYYGYNLGTKHFFKKEPDTQLIELENKPSPLAEIKPVIPVIQPIPEPPNVKQPMFDTQLLTRSIDWSTVTGCLTMESAGCVCYGTSGQRLVVPKESCELAAKYGWERKRT